MLWNDAYLMEQVSAGPDSFPSVEHWHIILAELHSRGLTMPETSSDLSIDPPSPQTRAILDAAASQMQEGIPAPEIESYLRERGLDGKRAAVVVSDLAEARHEVARKNVRDGAFWFIGAMAVTILTYLAAAPGETYILAWGAIIFGAIRYLEGMAAATAPKHTPPKVSPEADSSAREAPRTRTVPAGGAQQVPGEEIAAALADLAAQLLPTESLAVENAEVLFAGHRIAFTGVVEDAAEQGRNWLVGVRIEVNLDGRDRPNLTAGAVGSDGTLDAATTNALAIWAANIGVGILRALTQDTEGYQVGDYMAYPGLPMGRGGPEEGVSGGDVGGTPEIHRRILAALEPVINRWARGSLTSAGFLVHRAGRMAISGEVLIGGRRVDGMSALRTLDWPVTTSEYAYKVMYILVAR